ncbi:MAG: methionine synthase [Methanobacterium sp.]|nr:methionine synthase [Methanobacterium sp.]
MLTTVVGSYPAIPQKPKSLYSKISNVLGSYDQYIPAIEIAVEDQVNAGIDIISDGQVRGNMIEIFAENIIGMDVQKGISRIIGKIKPSNHSLYASDLKFALKKAQNISTDYKNPNKTASKLFKKNVFNTNFKGIKGIITGPTTLVLSCRIEGFYNINKKEEIIMDMAAVLKKEANELQNAGAAMIQIDEPFLSTNIVNINTAKKALKIIIEDLNIPISIHVCGEIGEILNDLLKFPVQIIDCEFAGNPSNISSFEQEYNSSKKIGFGCINTKNKNIENIDQISALIKKGVNIIGEENMIIDPDCGMRMFSRDTALLKLKTMKEAVEWL